MVLSRSELNSSSNKLTTVKYFWVLEKILLLLCSGFLGFKIDCVVLAASFRVILTVFAASFRTITLSADRLPGFFLFVGLFSPMAGSGSSMVYSFLLFTVVLSLQEMYRGKLASSELFTILGGFTSSILFLVLLTFIGNFQESCGTRTGWGAVILAEAVALIAAGTVHRVCITTCFLFSAALLYEVNKISGSVLLKSESKSRRH